MLYASIRWVPSSARLSPLFLRWNTLERGSLYGPPALWTRCGRDRRSRARRMPVRGYGAEQPTTEYSSVRANPIEEQGTRACSNLRPRLIYLTAAVLGFAFFALEFVWYRMLGPILGGTAFTFGLILCLTRDWPRRRRLQLCLPAVATELVRVGVDLWMRSVSAVVPLSGRSVGSCRRLARAGGHVFRNTDPGLGIYRVHCRPACSVGERPAVSVVDRPVGARPTSVSKHLGMTYAWNTLGAIAGSLIAGFGGLPLLWHRDVAGDLPPLAVLSLGIVLGAAAIAIAAPRLLWPFWRFQRCHPVPRGGPTAAWRHSGIGPATPPACPPNSLPNTSRMAQRETTRHVWQADGIESSVGINNRTDSRSSSTARATATR